MRILKDLQPKLNVHRVHLILVVSPLGFFNLCDQEAQEHNYFFGALA